jgi:imidazolonepropionase-like amidohydrolase
VNVLTHVSPDDRVIWDSATVSAMIKAKVALIPTLQLYYWSSKQEGLPLNNSLITTSTNQLSVFNKAGGLILFGTDVGYIPEYDPQDEFLMMEKAGMSFDQILASLTLNPARMFKPKELIGKIEKGYNADLIILGGDPSENIRNFTAIEYTFHNGLLCFKNK